MNKPIYVFSGFLDSGKTSGIKETLYDNNFNQGESTLIVSFEQGDVEFDSKFLKYTNSDVVYLDSLDEWTMEKQDELENEYDPERIIVELNGMFNDEDFYNKPLLKNWELAQRLTFIDASTFRMFMTNMSQIMYNHIIYSEVVVFNRIDNEDVIYLRNNIKAINARIAVVYEDSQGNILQASRNALFDLSKDLNISDADYGLWYMDALDDPKKYDGKVIEINAFYNEDIKEYENAGIFGRSAMVCCANDVRVIGFTVVNIDKKEITLNNYYHIKGKIKVLDDEEGNPTCVIYADSLKEIEKNEEVVNFN